MVRVVEGANIRQVDLALSIQTWDSCTVVDPKWH